MEVTLVMAILVIIAGVSYPAMSSMMATSRLNAAADQIRARWTEARSHAIQERQPYRFAVKDHTSQFRVAPDSSEFWSGGSAPAGGSDGHSVIEGSLPEQVVFGTSSAPSGSGSTASAGGSWRTVVTFLPDGTASDDVEISFSTNGSRTVSLKLRAATGASTTAALARPRP
jgi:Tfp pilus assembly protein FimT